MKIKLIRTTLLSICALGTLLLASCQAPQRHYVPSSAVGCSKCATIWFNAPASYAGSGGSNPAGGKGGLIALRSAGSMSCPDCQNNVIAILKSGSLTRHACASCGGKLYHCIKH
jgi:hypothetical protein